MAPGGFGGPVALVGYMHQDLVEQKKWISEEEYKEGLALAQLALGPLAAQLGIYMGFVPELTPCRCDLTANQSREQ